MVSLVILIDLDDTLTDRAAAFDAWAVLFLERNDRPRSELASLRAFDQRGIRPREEFFRLVLTHLGLKSDVAVELASYRAMTGVPTLHVGVRERLTSIRADGGVVVVLSNGKSETQRRKLESTGLVNSVDDVVISEEVGVAKPDSRIFEIAVARVGASARDDWIWMVGDNPDADIYSALKAHLRAAWVNPRGEPWRHQPGPEVIRPSTAECLDAITSLTPKCRTI